MEKSPAFWQFSGFVFTGAAGTLLHFLYGWTRSRIAAMFSAVNESTWEHMKLLFFPMFAFAIFESVFFAKENKNFWCAKLVGVLLGLAAIPILYYSYTGILGVSAGRFNILIFFIAAALSFIIETRIVKNANCVFISPIIAIAVFCIIAALFMRFTFVTPEIPLFRDPVTGNYGLV